MKHNISIFLVLVILWLLNSWHFTAVIFALGLLSIVLAVYVSHRMDVVDDESQPFHLSQRLPAYYYWLIKQIVRSNIDVVIHVWRGNRSISPCMETLDMSQETDMGRVIYANSLTLTPGTVAVDLTNEQVMVHALTCHGMDSLRGGEMDRRVRKLESR
ncbi:MAG: Na+/H+ antiporter subunit E [Pseudohongiellaceae bacterium]